MPFYVSGSSACSAWVLGVDSQERVIQFGISYSQFNSVFFVSKFNAGADNSYYSQTQSVSKHLFPILNAYHIHKKSDIWIPAIESRSWYSESFIQIKSLRLTFHCLPLILCRSDDWTSKPVECNHSLITHTPIIYLGDQPEWECYSFNQLRSMKLLYRVLVTDDEPNGSTKHWNSHTE